MSDFTVEDLSNRVLSEDFDIEQFLIEGTEDTYSYEIPIYADKDGKQVEYSFQAAKDERGFRKILRTETIVIKGYDDAYDELRDSDFLYEGGHIPGIGSFRMVDNGNLGDGHEAWSLVEHESGRLFRFGGWYSSWGESGTDSCVEVVPAEVKVVRYKSVVDGKVFDNPAVTV